MKIAKLLSLLLLVACPLIGRAQVPGFQNVVFVGSAPAGACTNGSPMQVVISTGVLYSCQASTWAVVGGGGGGGPYLPLAGGAMTGPLIAPIIIPYGTPVIDVRGAGAVCDGSHDDTSAIATAAALAGSNSGILYIPNTGHACTTTAAIQLPINAWMDVEGTLQATGAIATAVVVTGDATHVAGLQYSGGNNTGIYGHGSIDPNALAVRAIFVRQYGEYPIQDIHIGPGTAATAGVQWCDTTIGGYTCFAAKQQGTVTFLASGTSKVTNSIGIYHLGSDARIFNNVVVGYDFGVKDTGGNNTWEQNHVWGYAANLPSVCFLHTANLAWWIADTADTCTAEGFHLQGFGDFVSGSKVLSNAANTSGNFLGILFDQAAPYSAVSNTNFTGGGASNVMTAAISGATSNLEMFGNEYGNNVTSQNATPNFTNAYLSAGTANTPSVGDNSPSIATTAFVVARPGNIVVAPTSVNGIVGLANPTGTPTGTPSGSGGTIAASSFNYVQIVAMDANGNPTNQGTISAAVVTSGSTSSIAWSWTAVTNASSYRVYVCAGSSCTPSHYFTSGTNSYTQTLPATSGTSLALPGSNSTGNYNSATIFTPAATGYYLLCMSVTETTAASSSSTLPYGNAIFVSPIDSNTKYSGITPTSGGNGTYVANGGCGAIYAKISTAIAFQTGGYAASGATLMAYSITYWLVSQNANGL